MAKPSRKTVKVTHVRRTLQYQSNSGVFRIEDDLAKLLGFKNAENLRTVINSEVTKRKTSARIVKLETNVWVTIFVLYYYRFVAADHREVWVTNYWLAYQWLWAQFTNNEAVEIDAFRIIKSIAISHYSVDQETEDIDAAWEKEVSSQKTNVRKGITGSRVAGKMFIRFFIFCVL
jgi:hypothetical protein